MPVYGGHVHTKSFSVASQAIAANTVTYITGSGILIPSGGLVVGMALVWNISVAKTGAGTATPVWTYRNGTLQTTGDNTWGTLTGSAQVATASGTVIIHRAVVKVVGVATGVVTSAYNTGAATFGIGSAGTSSAYNNTAEAGKYYGLCVNTGASAAWTIHAVDCRIE
jgi:hypothetical protein